MKDLNVLHIQISFLISIKNNSPLICLEKTTLQQMRNLWQEEGSVKQKLKLSKLKLSLARSEFLFPMKR